MKSNKQINNKSKKFRKINGGSINTKFVNACKLGLVEDAMNYIENPKININFKDNEGNTALQYACLLGNLELVDALVKRGADINSRGRVDNTPLHNTCIYNNNNNVFIVKILLDNGADINAKNMDGRTPLDNACYNGHLDLALVIIDSGADIYLINDYNQTLLHRASFNGPVDLVKILIDKGIDIHFKDAQNMTALHIACGKGNMEIAIALVDMGADISAKDKAGRTPLQIAPPIIDKRKLIEHSLLYRERMQNIEAERELEEKRKQEIHNLYKSEKKIDPITGNRGINKCSLCRSLYYESKDTQIQHWKSGHREQCRELCQMKKNDINQKGGKRKTKKNKNKKKGGGKLEIKFFLAVLRDQTELVLSILEKGVDIDTKHDDNDHVNWMQDGYTALHYACHNRIGNMVHLLIGEGANMEITDSEGMKPLHIASQKGYIDIIEILLKYGADINMKKGNEGGMDNESPGATSLHEVIYDFQFITNKFQVVEFLLKNGADINAVDDNGNTPLHYALEFVNVYTDDQYEESIKIANLLINEGAHVNASNNEGDTPLHLLLSSEMIYRSYETDVDTMRLIRTIINKGADYEAKNKKGKTPLDYTYEDENEDENEDEDEDEDKISYEEWLEFKRVILNHIHNLPKERVRRILLEKGSEDTKSILSKLPKEVVKQNIEPYLYGGKRKTKKKRNKIKNKNSKRKTRKH